MDQKRADACLDQCRKIVDPNKVKVEVFIYTRSFSLSGGRWAQVQELGVKLDFTPLWLQGLKKNSPNVEEDMLLEAARLLPLLRERFPEAKVTYRSYRLAGSMDSGYYPGTRVPFPNITIEEAS